jgi:hypothetical protein
MPDSDAIVNFRESLGMARELLVLEARFNDPPGVVEALTVSGLRGGAAVIMVAAFENFLREVILERLSAIGGTPPSKSLSALPVQVQVGSIFSSLEHAMYGPRYGATGGRIARLVDIRRSAKLIENDTADIIALSDPKGNPGPDALASLLKNLGIEDPFNALRPEFDRRWRKPEMHTYLRDKLDEVVVRRHRVAHAADVLSVSRADLQHGLEFLHTLSETIDAFLEQHIAGL